MPIAFMPQPQCKACNLIADQAGDNPPHTAALYRKFKKVNQGLITLKSVQRELAKQGQKVSYDALRNHAQKHQDVSADTLKAPVGKSPRADRTLQAERVVNIELAEKQLHHTERRASILDKLQAMADNGELKGATFTAMATLLKQEADIEEKQKDRTQEMAKLFAQYVGNPLAIADIPQPEYVEAEVVESDTPRSD